MSRLTKADVAKHVRIDYSRDEILTENTKLTLNGRYLIDDEGPQDAFARAAVAFSGGDDALAQRIYDYASKQWFMYATPLLANGGAGRGLPISCFLNYVEDSIEGLTANFEENAFLATNGGGIGSFWGHVRSVGEKTSKGVDTPGVMPFMHCIDSQMLAYRQGTTRRGSGAPYLDIDHPEIEEFITMRKPTGSQDVHRKNMNLHHAVGLTDEFMQAVKFGGTWTLVDPHSKLPKGEVKARDLWIKILQTRVDTGEPFLFYKDTANRALPKALRDAGLYIHHSNLCTEITLPTGPSYTAVCCLSSINLAKWHEYKDVLGQFVADLVRMLDNVLDVFIRLAPQQLWRAVQSARAERSLGLGTLGWHTLLQQDGISIEHEDAATLNEDIFSRIKAAAEAESRRLAVERGEPKLLKGTGLRNAHLMAIAPNATSSIICGGVSPSVEPLAANAFIQKTLSGSQEVRNPALVPILEAYGRNDDETWTSIIINEGSVQHLDFLTLWEKAVFKTAIEIDQMKLIDLAAQRQKYICQAQSINLFVPANVQASVLHKLHFSAWEKGLKSLYYLRSKSVKATEVVSGQTERAKVDLPDAPAEECVACEA